MYQMRPPGIPMLPGYEYTDYTRTDFARRQHCEVKGGAFFVSQPRRPIPGRPTSKVEPPGAAPLGAHNAGAPGAPSARPPPLPLPERPPSAPPRSSAPAAGERPAPRRAPAFASAEPGVPGGWTPDEARDAREHLPASSLVPAPAWASDDSDAMLAFHAYFRETVSAGEPDAVERVRTCTLTFHVGDGTMQVYERPVENSGMPQGVLLKRHRVRSPRGGYYSLADLNVGVELDCYGRVYVLASCDAFTRAFLEAHGVRVGEELAVPKDPSALQSWPPGVVGGSRADDDDEITPPRPAEPSALQRFLQFDRIVLRYYLLWDEGIPTYLKRKLTMHYFLVDGTAEVFENKAELMAASRTTDILPLSVGRQRIPLKYETAGQAGFGPAKGVLYLAPKDILVGSHINVFGRRCFVYDADGATREWMAEREGVTLAPSLEKETLAFQKKVPRASMPTPPHTGFGSEEDSLNSVYGGLMPRARAKRDMFRPAPPEPGSLAVGTKRDGDRALRFTAKLDSGSADDASREFVVSFFPADSTVQVFETRSRNSGYTGGSFLERCRAPLPQPLPDGPRQYALHHFYTGAHIDLHGRRLVLGEADLYATRFLAAREAEIRSARADEARQRAALETEQRRALENEAESYAARAPAGEPGAVDEARVDHLEAQLRAILTSRSAHSRKVFRTIDRNADGRITISEFAHLLSELHLELDANEVAALMARFDRGGRGFISYDAFCDAVITQDFGDNAAEPLNVGSAPRPSTAPIHRDRPAPELLRAYTRAEASQEEDASVDRALMQIRAAFSDRGVRMAVLFREMDTERKGTLGLEEFRAAFKKHNLRVSEREFGLMMAHLQRHAGRPDGRIPYATFGVMLGRQ